MNKFIIPPLQRKIAWKTIQNIILFLLLSNPTQAQLWNFESGQSVDPSATNTPYSFAFGRIWGGWHSSHGSPNVNHDYIGHDPNQYAILYAVRNQQIADAPPLTPDTKQRGEGIYLECNFEKGKPYVIKVRFRARQNQSSDKADHIFMYLSNSLVERTNSNVPKDDPTSISNDILPVVTDKWLIPESAQLDGFNSTDWHWYYITFIPPKTYKQLWIYPWQDPGTDQQGIICQMDDFELIPFATVQGTTLSRIPCLSSKTYADGTTNYPTWTMTQSYIYTSGTNIVQVGTNSGVGVTFQAAEYIQLTSGLHCENGSYFHAFIKPCDNETLPCDFIPKQQASLLMPSNLVYNPGFDSLYHCPLELQDSVIPVIFHDALTMSCQYWTAANATTPDYFNACNTNATCTTANYQTMVSTPTNAMGYQQPVSGQAYAGIKISTSNTWKEYVQGMLIQPMIAGKTYDVSFYVSLAEASSIALKGLGAYLSTTFTYQLTTANLTVTPQIIENNAVTDTTNWVKISGTYTAAGGEDHIIIGYFKSTLNAGTDYVNVTKGTACYEPTDGFAYYYIDSVSVVQECYCGNGYYDLKLETTTASSPQRCFNVKVKRLTDGCPIYGIRLRPASGSPFVSTTSGTWTLSPPPGSQTPAWTTTASIAEGDSLIVGTFCVNSTSTSITLQVDYLRFDGSTMCSVAQTIEPPDCCAYVSASIASYSPNSSAQNCCYTLTTMVPLNLPNYCDLTTVRVSSQDGALLSNYSSSGSPTPQPSITFYRSGTFISGNFCIENNGNIVEHTLVFEYLDANGLVRCTKYALVSCGCICDASFYFTNFSKNTDSSGQCCWNVDITASANACALYGVRITRGSSTIFQKTSFSGGPISPGQTKTVGAFCLSDMSFGTSASIKIVYLRQDGSEMCNVDQTLFCDQACCTTLQVTTQSYQSSTSCCGYIHATKMPNTSCSVFGINIVGGQGGVPLQSKPLTLPSSGSPNVVGYYCIAPGSTATITVEFLNANGSVKCHKSFTISCTAVGSARSEADNEQQIIPVTGAPVGTPSLRSVPNPASDEALITVNLHEQSQVKLEVYSLIGQRVAVLDEGYRTHSYTVRFRTEGLTSGMYYLRLSYKGGVVSIPISISKE